MSSQIIKDRYKILEKDHVRNNYYKVVGAGELQVSKKANSDCGTIKNGFHIGVSWGKHGFAGGAISREDAWLLAKRIAVELKMDLL